jgi:hypothetical protein
MWPSVERFLLYFHKKNDDESSSLLSLARKSVTHTKIIAVQTTLVESGFETDSDSVKQSSSK